MRIPNHCDALTFSEQIELESRMQLICQVPDRPSSRTFDAGEFENVQRLAETLLMYRETNNPVDSQLARSETPERCEMRSPPLAGVPGRSIIHMVIQLKDFQE